MSATWLHVSDFHIRGGDPYDRDVVLGALVRSVKDYRETKGRQPDLIFATGDIAQSGKSAEYAHASRFFDALLDATQLDRRHLFIVPGNHDIDRDLGIGLARTLSTREEVDGYFGPSVPKPHITQKLSAFRSWYDDYFKGIRQFPTDTTCGPLEVVDVRGIRIAVLALNSALFCQDDADHSKLLLGRRCLQSAMTELAKQDVQLKVALVHHPLDWLSDVERPNIKTSIQETVDVLLRGHLHETEVESVASAYGATLHLAAGASYQTRKWPQRAYFATFDKGQLCVFPLRYEDSPKEIWTVDPSVFPHDKGYERLIPIPHFIQENARVPVPSPPAPAQAAIVPRFRSNIASRGGLPFIGRDQLLQEIKARLGDLSRESGLVLHGPPGVGKSELAREYARQFRDAYPGGTFFLRTGGGTEMLDLSRVGANALDLKFQPHLSLQDQCEQTLLSLGSAPTLLIYDNVTDSESIRPWLPRSGMPCHVLFTSINERVIADWPGLPVPPLEATESLELVERIAGRDVAANYGGMLVRQAEGLPIQIVPAARSLAYEARRGRLKAVAPALSKEAKSSFTLVYASLEPPSRLLLHAAAFLNNQQIVRDELVQHVSGFFEESATDFDRQLDVCMDLHLLEGESDLRMHQLFASFVNASSVEPALVAPLARIRSAQQDRFLALARSVAEKPANREYAVSFFTYPVSPQIWETAGIKTSMEDGELVGRALYEVGRFDEARPWFERAVKEAEQGDVHGRVDHESLGSSLHVVGYCYSSVGKYDEARPWFERAVAEKEQGDVHGRVDHESLGRSLHQVGYCYSSVGKYDEARPWFERAVKEAEQGDVHGRVDHASLGRSLHQVGGCYSSVGKYDEARPWFERAVKEAEQGDVHGRVDHASLGRSLHLVGYCYSSVGKYDEARPWFERAVKEAEQGDVHGRVDHDSLGRSLHQVGDCYSSVGKYDEARPWFERAVKEAEQGDVHGRVDHDSLGSSLHVVGYCYSSVGKYDEARPWFERAVKEAEQGDVHGRVDHASLGRSLHQVGYCYSSVGKYDEARPWFERAVGEKEQGDVHGRVDHDSLGRSLHQVGDCYSSVGKYDEARPWFERAVGEKEQGDVHGRVDHESVKSSIGSLVHCLRELGMQVEAERWDQIAAGKK